MGFRRSCHTLVFLYVYSEMWKLLSLKFTGERILEKAEWMSTEPV